MFVYCEIASFIDICSSYLVHHFLASPKYNISTKIGNLVFIMSYLFHCMRSMFLDTDTFVPISFSAKFYKKA